MAIQTQDRRLKILKLQLYGNASVTLANSSPGAKQLLDKDNQLLKQDLLKVSSLAALIVATQLVVKIALKL